jgi:hypothetical protein
MSNHYPSEEYKKLASEYYDVEAAEKLLDTPVLPPLERWRCTLCGWPLDITKAQAEVVGACCCGGCGMSCLRPIAEWSK